MNFSSIKQGFVFSIFVIWISSILHVFFDYEILALFFDRENGGWLVQKDHAFLHILFYQLPKILFVLFCCYVFIFGCLFSKQPGRHFVVGLMIIASPIVVALLKGITGVECPKDLLFFEGTKLHHSLYESLLSGTGRCFPGGHVSAGFGLFPLLCITSERFKLRLFWAIALLGNLMGLYQLARGYHFLSHNLFTMGMSYSFYCLSMLLIRSYGETMDQFLLNIQKIFKKQPVT